MQTVVSERVRQVRTDQPQGTGLRVVPILGPQFTEPDYALLGPETTGRVQVSEISASGSVPVVRVVNGLSTRLFLMDGQELVGAKQNRILNTDVLVPAGKTLDIPVSCVEAGRWRPTSTVFQPGKAASYRTRSSKLDRIYDALKRKGEHDADQHAVWAEVDAALEASEVVSSPTRALSDAYARREQEMVEFRRQLCLPGAAVGVAVFHGDAFRGLDLFDRHSTLQAFWSSLVDSYAIDFLGAPVDPSAPSTELTAQRVRAVLDEAIAGGWEAFASPGEGVDWRVSTAGVSGAALVWEDRVVLHLQIFPGRSDSGEGPQRLLRRLRSPMPRVEDEID